MSEFRRRWILAGIAAMAAMMFLVGVHWGLPSHKSDSFLFGQHQVWTGQQILDLAGGWDESADRGADIAMHPLGGRDHPIVVNETDAQRAAIVQRFRLYSFQPDEMITFRSLSAMKPGRGDFDPRFYQYGGLWVYPVGAILKIAALLHRVTLRADLVFYLDHPEQFGKFYVLARLYSAMWGLIGVGVVFAIGRQWSGEFVVGALAASFYVLMPVVVNMAHEAKPHLPGTVLTLAAVLAAMRFVRLGRRRDWILAGIVCGLAFSMVLTGLLSFVVLFVMTLLRPMGWSRRMGISFAAAGIGLAVFAIINPYLPYNFLFHRELVRSNVGNYGTFYHPEISWSGCVNAVRLIGLGMSLPLAIAAAFALLGLVFNGSKRVFQSSINRNGWLLFALALLVLLQYVLLARDKPAEYGRFALTLDVILALSVAYVLGSMQRFIVVRGIIAFLLIVGTGISGLLYVGNFVADMTPISSRLEAARSLSSMENGSRELAVWAEPAPYCLPPVDLFAWKIVLMPRGTARADGNAVSVRPVDVPGEQPGWAAAPISWANKPFEIAPAGP